MKQMDHGASESMRIHVFVPKRAPKRETLRARLVEPRSQQVRMLQSECLKTPCLSQKSRILDDDLAVTFRFPKFRYMLANEVILKPGDMLYVPAYWFHYIVSLNVNWQCNSRSGRSVMYRKDVSKCGF